MTTVVSLLGMITPGPSHIQIDKRAIDITPDDVRSSLGLDSTQPVTLRVSYCNSVTAFFFETAEDLAQRQYTSLSATTTGLVARVEASLAFFTSRINSLRRKESELVVVMGEEAVWTIVEALDSIIFSLAPSSDQQADLERGPYLTNRQIRDIKQGRMVGRGRTHINATIKRAPTSDRNCRPQQAAPNCLTKKQLDIARRFCTLSRLPPSRRMTKATAKLVLQDAVENGRFTLTNDVTIDDLCAFIDTCPNSNYFYVIDGSRYFCELEGTRRVLASYTTYGLKMESLLTYD